MLATIWALARLQMTNAIAVCGLLNELLHLAFTYEAICQNTKLCNFGQNDSMMMK